MDKARNALAVPHQTAISAQEAIADILLNLEIWSERQPLQVNAAAQQELRGYFRNAHRLLSQAEQAFDSIMMSAQIGREVESVR